MATYVITTATNVNAPTAFGRALARASDGRLWTIYSRSAPTSFELFVAYSDDDGVNWTEEQLTTQEANQYPGAIAVDSQDNVHIAWRGSGWPPYTARPEILYCRRTASGWDSIEQLTDIDAEQRLPSLAIDSQDNVHISWTGMGWGTNSSDNNIQYRKKDSEGWQSQEGVTDESVSQYNPSIACDTGDDVHLVWAGHGWDGYTERNIEYKKRTSEGWQAREAVTATANWQLMPSLFVDPNDELHVFWYGKGWGSNPGVYNVQYRKRTAAGWQPRESVTDSADTQRDGSVTKTGDGSIHGAWRGLGWGSNSSNDNIQRKERNGSWGSRVAITDRAYHQGPPGLIGALHPQVGGVRPNIPETGCAFVWTSATATGNQMEIYISDDLAWPQAPSGMAGLNPAILAILFGVA